MTKLHHDSVVSEVDRLIEDLVPPESSRLVRRGLAVHRVTVVIPIYNRSQALRATIDSVLTQTYSDWELILVDDGSIDDSAVVAQSYKDPRIRYVWQQHQGHSKARNRGLDLAGGEYIAFLDHDDRWLPEKLKLQVDFLDSHPEIGLVYGRWKGIDELGKVTGIETMHELSGWVYKDLLMICNFLVTMSLPMARTNLLRQSGGFDHRAGICDDLDLFLKLARITPFGFIPQYILLYNLGNPNQQTKDTFMTDRQHWNCIVRHTRIGSELSRSERAEIRRKWRNHYSAALRNSHDSAYQEARSKRGWAYYAHVFSIDPFLLIQLCKSNFFS